jgi:hypothetical protein
MNASPEPFEHEQCIKWEEDNANTIDDMNERPQFPLFTGFNLRGSSNNQDETNKDEDEPIFYNGIGNTDDVIVGSQTPYYKKSRRNCIVKKKILLRKHGNALYHWITDMEGTSKITKTICVFLYW